jgi:CheY-like chemotaxis protein
MRILLVEDNPENLDMLSRRLVRRGYQVSTAIDGEAAIERAQTELPDLILMDLSLPVIDGWQAIRILKAQRSSAHIPIIALTAHAMAGDRERALDAGANDYDTKPVDIERLVGKIESLADR